MNLRIFQWQSLKTRLTLFTVGIFVLGIWLLAFYASRILRDDLQQMLGEQQFAAVSVIAQEINDHLSDRLQAVESIAKEVSPALLADSVALQTLLEQRPLLQLLFNGGVFVTVADGTAMADVPRSADRVGTNYLDREFVAVTLKQGLSVIGRPIMGKKLQAPIFSISTPIRDGKGQVIGALVGAVNLGQPSFLDQIVHGRYGQTGSYVLIAPKHKLIVKGSDKSRTMLPVPAPGLNTMHDRYMQGYEGFGLATSSRGVLELSAAKGIAASGWFLVATLPAQEAFAPIDHVLQRLFLGAIVFTVLAGALTWWLIQRLLQGQLAPLLAASRALASQATTDGPAQALPVLRQDEIGELIGGFNHLLAAAGKREQALTESEAKFRAVVELAPDAILLHCHAKLAFVNPAAVKLFGASTEQELIGKPVLELIHPDFHQIVLDRIKRTHQTGQPEPRIEERFVKLDGTCFDVEASGRQLVLGGEPFVFVTIRDITERKQAQAKLRLAASVFAHTREGIMITGANADIMDVNEAFTRITGYSRDEVLGKNPHILSSGRHDAAFFAAMWRSLSEQGYWSNEIWNRRKSGEVFAERLTISAVCDASGSVQHYVALFSDITAHKAMEDQVHQMAYFDALTGLPNRRLLGDRLSQAMVASKRSGLYGALMFLDLDNFKPINDTQGHGVGDLLLIEVARRLTDCVREADSVARLGGDEFVVMLSELGTDQAESSAQARAVAEKIRDSLATPYQLALLHAGGQSTMVEHRCSASIGVVMFGHQQASQADILKWADAAMYQAKQAGRNVVRFA